MKENAKAAQEDNLAKVTLGYDNDLILPLEDALNLMRMLKKAERVRSYWNAETKNSTSHLGAEMNNFTVSLFPHSEYMTIKLNGEYPKDK